ncbi:MAG: hypothetical protein U1F21_14740 [Sphaerotilus natans]
MNTSNARITGPVEYRLGDGPKCRIPRGPVEIQQTPQDVTISWESGDTHQNAALPQSEFRRYINEKAIVLTQ